jgi:Na+(H+)/acetate symporter ActP
VEAVDSGSTVYVTDGLYSQKILLEIDGVGYMIYCTTRRKVVLKGSFYERFNKAGSYQGELLGLLAVHLIILAIKRFYALEAGPCGLVGCNNLGGLKKLK